MLNGMERPRLSSPIGALFPVAVLALLALLGCDIPHAGSLTILSGSENEALEPLLEEFTRETGIGIEMRYLGSVDIMLELAKADFDADAVWPANSLWLTLGDTERRIRHAQSIFTSPVVFGIRRSKAQELGFVGKDVAVRDILNAIRSGKLAFMMTSATQSNSGASAYLGFLYALLGNPDVLTEQDLQKPELEAAIRDLLGGVNRSSGSSGWLKELFLKTPDADAMVNYESTLIETNQELERQGREPLYLVYPVDGLIISDSPLGFNGQRGQEQEQRFLKLKEWLLKPETQKRLLDLGRRTGLGGDLSGADPKVFRPDWGIDPSRIISTARLPGPRVIQRALDLYQTTFRKPSFTVFALDYSGSMAGDGEAQLEEAMRILLDQEEAGRFLIQAGQRDRWVILTFSGGIKNQFEAEGNDPSRLRQLWNRLVQERVGGSTDIHSPIIRGLELYAALPTRHEYIPAIVLMTDGAHNTGPDFAEVERLYRKLRLDVPVFAILFGEADPSQLEPLAELTRGRVFDGRKDLTGAFRKVRGYN